MTNDRERPITIQSTSAMKCPLHGVRVLESGSFIAAPMAARILADTIGGESTAGI